MRVTVIQRRKPLTRPRVIEILDDVHVAPERREILAGGNVPVAVQPGPLLPAAQPFENLPIFRVVERIVAQPTRRFSFRYSLRGWASALLSSALHNSTLYLFAAPYAAGATHHGRHRLPGFQARQLNITRGCAAPGFERRHARCTRPCAPHLPRRLSQASLMPSASLRKVRKSARGGKPRYSAEGRRRVDIGRLRLYGVHDAKNVLAADAMEVCEVGISANKTYRHQNIPSYILISRLQTQVHSFFFY
jgi:hypothetical protein